MDDITGFLAPHFADPEGKKNKSHLTRTSRPHKKTGIQIVSKIVSIFDDKQ